jgi:exopolysaccharide production protein ExoZ
MTSSEHVVPNREGGQETRLLSLQVARAVAALGVVFLHIFPVMGIADPPGNIRYIGSMGVDIFFVLSGAIITLVAKTSPDLFIIKRLVRIIPFYFFMTLFALILFDEYDYARILTSFTLWPVWGEIARPVLYVGWSLSFEMLFYLAAALVLWSPVMLPVLLILYAGCFIAYMTTGLALFAFLGNPIIVEFLMGSAIALFWKRKQSRSIPVAAALALSAMALISMIPNDIENIANYRNIIDGSQSLQRIIVFGPPSVFLIFACLYWHVRHESVMTYIGDISYALYLSHALAIGFLFGLAGQPPVVAGSLAIGICVCLAAVVHERIEKPLLAWSRRIIGLRSHDRVTAPPHRPGPPVHHPR